MLNKEKNYKFYVLYATFLFAIEFLSLFISTLCQEYTLTTDGSELLGSLYSSSEANFRITPKKCKSRNYINIEARLMVDKGTRVQALLMVNTLGKVPEELFDGNKSTGYNNGTVVDYYGFSFRRTYHLVSLQLNSTQNQNLWIISLRNKYKWSIQPVSFAINASCTANPICPSSCHGKGKCIKGNCSCLNGWGDFDCSTPLIYLPLNNNVSHVLLPEQIKFFSYEVKQENMNLLVEMYRSRGDPLLLIKKSNLNSNDLLSVYDADVADVDSFQQRLNYHHILIHNVPVGLYFIAVDYQSTEVNETGEFRLSAISKYGALCPLNCSYPNGICELTKNGSSQCRCNKYYSGFFCQGPLTIVETNIKMIGVIMPGNWAFFSFNFKGDEDSTLVIKLKKIGGQALFLAKEDGIPTWINNDYRFSTLPSTQAAYSIFNIVKGTILQGTFIFAIFNNDYFAHLPCYYELEFAKSDSSSKFLFSNVLVNISIGLTVAVSIFLVLGISRALVIHHRERRRRERSRRQREEANGNGNGNGNSAATELPFIRNNGLDHSIILSFPTFRFDTMNQVTEEEIMCPVCLSEYKEEDELRKLPKCNHSFHVSCIDKWLLKSASCPLCRISLSSLDDPKPHPRRHPHIPLLLQDRDPASSSEHDDSHGDTPPPLSPSLSRPQPSANAASGAGSGTGLRTDLRTASETASGTSLFSVSSTGLETGSVTGLETGLGEASASALALVSEADEVSGEVSSREIKFPSVDLKPGLKSSNLFPEPEVLVRESDSASVSGDEVVESHSSPVSMDRGEGGSGGVSGLVQTCSKGSK